MSKNLSIYPDCPTKEQKKTAFHSIIAEHGLFVKGEILMCVEAAGE